MNRRFLLQGLGSLTLASALSGCGSASDQRVSVEILRRTFPVQLLNQAKRTLSPKTPVRISTSSTVSELYGQLQRWQQAEVKRRKQAEDKGLPQVEVKGLRLCGLGDYWLTQAIQSDLIEPLDLSEAMLDKLPTRWQRLVQRNAQGLLASTGLLWGAPYRWGATVLAYRKDKWEQLGWALQDWEDLWNPALKQRVGLLNQPREVIGMTLKTLGQSYNDPNPVQQPRLKSKLRSLHQQARLYSSRNYLEPLIMGDIWVAMGWSSDVIPALAQDPNLDVMFPASGSSIWADIWVKSKVSAANSEEFPVNQLTNQWVDYWWQEEGARAIAKFTNSAAVIPLSSEPENDTLLTQKNFDASEFLLPLTPEAIAQYRALWLEMRSI